MGINVPRPDLTYVLAKTLDEILKQSMNLIPPEIRNLLPEELTNVQSFAVQTIILPNMLKQYLENFVSRPQSIDLPKESCESLVYEFTDKVLEISREIQNILTEIRLENTEGLTPEIIYRLQECINKYVQLLIEIVGYLPRFKELTKYASTDIDPLNAW